MKILTLCLLAAVAPPATALTIKIDYTYDTNNFFNTPEKKSAMEAVAKFYGDLIQDNLLRIDPADFPPESPEIPAPTWTGKLRDPTTGLVILVPGLIIPEDTVIVYVGSRVFAFPQLADGGFAGLSASGSSAWRNRVVGRGSAGATAMPQTDHSPWGGSIAFDSVGPWNFSQSEDLPGYEFISSAFHEMAHVLGIGTSKSWSNKVVTNTFTGPAAFRSHGAPIPLESGNFHFSVTTRHSPRFGSFGKTHGTLVPAAMLVELTDDDPSFIVPTDLDLACLVDCGWQISPPLGLSTTSLQPTGADFSWKSSSFLDYTVQRSSDLVTFSDASGLLAGNGQVKTWNDTAPLPGKGFYRLRSTRPTAFPALQMMQTAPRSATSPGEFRSVSIEPMSVACGEGICNP